MFTTGEASLLLPAQQIFLGERPYHRFDGAFDRRSSTVRVAGFRRARPDDLVFGDIVQRRFRRVLIDTVSARRSAETGPGGADIGTEDTE